MSKSFDPRRWRPRSTGEGLFLAATVYVLATLMAQWIGSTPPWLDTSPVELSTDFLASCGLVWTALRLGLGWRHQSLRSFWFKSSLAMILIWMAESAADAFESADYRLIILTWAVAAGAMALCIRHYALSYGIRLIVQLGLLAQTVAHGVWIIQDGLLQAPDGVHPQMELLTDAGELVAILSYIAALILSRRPLLDDLRRPLFRDASALPGYTHRAHADDAAVVPAPPMKIAFLYNAQLHQIPHSLPIALELAAAYRDVEVDVVGISQRHLDFARCLAKRYGLVTPVRFVELHKPWFAHAQMRLSGALSPSKKISLRANSSYFSSCDALVTPERTSLALRRFGLPARTRLMFTDHGAGDRAIAGSDDISEFDFVFVPGAKIESRWLEHGLIRPGDYVRGVYAKFDWLRRPGNPPPPLFDNDRPTILYNPHFDSTLSSWPEVGERVLEYFAASQRYNLIFAPHVRLFEPPRPSKYRPFQEYARLAHMRIDLGSERCIDMSYTLAADVYLGDVSSQVAEFMLRPRPCLFLNPRHRRWQGDPNYQFWTLGPVLEDIGHLEEALQQAIDSHPAYTPAQQEYFAHTFDGADGAPSARLGADAIVAYLRREASKAKKPG